MIPRKFGDAPTTKPNHAVTDEASLDLRLQALLELLIERGVIERDPYLETLRRLLKERAGE